MISLSQRLRNWGGRTHYQITYLMVGLLAMMPQWSFAESNPLNFSPPESDASVKLLGKIFGLVDGVLYGTGSQIVGEMFGMFNSAVLVLGAIVLIYTTLMSITNTANEGEYLGQRWNSIWIPVRSVVGVALLIPKASGYCAIQIFVMWVVIQGVGAADLIWNSALDYLQRGGVIVAQNVQVDTGEMYLQSSTKQTGGWALEQDEGNWALTYDVDSGTDEIMGVKVTESNIFKESGKVLKALVCMHSLQYALEMQREEFLNPSIGGVDPGLVPVFFSYIRVLGEDGRPIKIDDGTGQRVSMVKFPPETPNSPLYNNYAGVCGHVKWNNFTASEIGAKLDAAGANPIKVNGQYSDNDPRIAAAIKTRALAVGQLVNDLSSVAETIVNNYKQPEDARLPLGMWSSTGSTSAPASATWIGDRNFSKQPLLLGSELRNASRAYFSLIQPTMRLLQGSLEDIDFIGDAKKDGWLLAGSYFFKLALVNQNISGFDMSNESLEVVDNSAAIMSQTPLEITVSGATNTFRVTHDTLRKTPLSDTGLYSYNNSLLRYVNDALLPRDRPDAPANEADLGEPVPFQMDEVQIPNKFNCENILCTGAIKFVAYAVANLILKASTAISNEIIKIVLDPIHALGMFFLNTVKDAFRPGKNPVIELAMLGKKLIDFGFDMIVMFLLSVILISLLLTAGMGLALVFIILLGPVVFAVASILISYGTIFAFYIPLIPYLVFTFASVAWFVAVIEAMVAAPIVALGLAHPEGHDSFGKAQEAIMLLANIFLRPALMIIGFVIAIILSFVTFHLVNAGFFRAAQAITGTAFGIGSAIAPLFIVGLYATITMQVMQKSFDLIYLLPDRVLRWIGGHGTPGVSGEQFVGGGGADTGGGAVGGAKAAAESASQMTSQGVESAGKAVEAMAMKKLNAKMNKKDDKKGEDDDDEEGDNDEGDNDDDLGVDSKEAKGKKSSSTSAAKDATDATDAAPDISIDGGDLDGGTS